MCSGLFGLDPRNCSSKRNDWSMASEEKLKMERKVLAMIKERIPIKTTGATGEVTSK